MRLELGLRPHASSHQQTSQRLAPEPGQQRVPTALAEPAAESQAGCSPGPAPQPRCCWSSVRPPLRFTTACRRILVKLGPGPARRMPWLTPPYTRACPLAGGDLSASLGRSICPLRGLGWLCGAGGRGFLGLIRSPLLRKLILGSSKRAQHVIKLSVSSPEPPFYLA